jgi:hypothetical protein
LGDDQVFLEFLLDGIVKLYYVKYMHLDHYFFEKDSVLSNIRSKEESMTLPGKFVLDLLQGKHGAT